MNDFPPYHSENGRYPPGRPLTHQNGRFGCHPCKLCQTIEKVSHCVRPKGTVYGRGTLFTKKFCDCLVRFLDCFYFWLCHPRSVKFTAWILRDGLKWIVSVIRAIGHGNRGQEGYVQEILREIGNQRVHR
jgi:hypothetical protein